ncbi:MAG: bifunctional adenosylcobinamide kinase/adenosylcobinamide-phosphate guanylyltransferase [Clostridia bacterium]|nr:bifunctional adenosylcobinamide kinase/adenosylcobinamide-phosphate guanylyltransferase [Clostridia bacterium]
MKLYIGGAFQGQAALARTQNPDAVIIEDFHLLIREKMNQHADIQEYIKTLCETQPDCVIVSDEIGSGIVPIDQNDRLWRETVGRALCTIARQAEQVIRVVCGIGVRIK